MISGNSKYNIALIGMAGCGKSVTGKKLAYELGFLFLDLDDAIEIEHHKKLNQLIEEIGEDKFIELESKALLKFLKTGPRETVIAPGGSIVLSEKAVIDLRKNALIVFIDTPFHVIRKRTLNRKTRGAVIGLKGKKLKDVYDFRLPLYEKYADFKINVGSLSEEQVVEKIVNLLPDDFKIYLMADKGADFY